MTKVLVVTETGDAWPSGYVRALIYKDRFARDGIDARFMTRLVPRLTKAANPTGRLLTRALSLGAGRALRTANDVAARARAAAIVRAAAEADVVYLQKTTSWPLLQAIRARSKARIVYDLNDGVWLRSRPGFAKGHLHDILRTVDAVTCDNPYGLEHARAYTQDLHLVPDPPQVEDFDAARASHPRRSGGPLVLGWIGSPGTLFNLFSIWEPLERLFAKRDDITLRMVGTGSDKSLWPRFENVTYTTLASYDRQAMIREVLSMDVGLFPMYDIQDSYARGILKASVYMSGGACLVATPLGQVNDVVQDRKNGILPASPDEWVSRIEEVLDDADLRARIADAGLATARSHFSVDQCYARLKGALLGVSA